MEILLPIIVLLCGISIGILLKLLHNKFKNFNFDLIIKILSILLFVIICTRYLIIEPPMYQTRGLNINSPFGDDIFKTIIGLLLSWFTYGAVFFIILNPFFKINNIKNFIKFFGIIVLILDLVFLDTYLVAISNSSINNINAMGILGLIEIGLSISIFTYCFADLNYFKITKKEVVTLLITLIPILLVTMPSYIPQALLGFTFTEGVAYKDLSPFHRVCIYCAFIIPFIIYKVFKDKSDEVKRFLLIFLSISFLWTFMIRFPFIEWSSFKTWPLHLCNTAMYILPICLIFKFKKVFYFTFFINVLGAFLALFIPQYGDANNLMHYRVLAFYINHWSAFFMPILVVALGVFERPKLKDWFYSMIAFLCYFVFVLIVNAYYGTDFFYINGSFILDKLGKWTDFSTKVVWKVPFFGKVLEFKPIYQSLFFLIYVGFSVGIWFIYEQLFIVLDKQSDVRAKMRAYKALKKEYAVITRNRGEDMEDRIPCLELINFSKKYGSNKHYAVDNVSLKVEGGIIFGFLGHNGAGKSTIIKSIVGIQSKTSGTIKVCGYDNEMEAPLAKKQIGFVPDHYALYENLTGREYINFIADLYGVSKSVRDERIEKYLTNFQLHDAFDNQMKTYSHGMKQKIAIMAALIHNPKVWILDEPLTGLDPNSIFQVKVCMKEHASNGNIVFFSSHIIDVVEKICDKIAIIKKGVLQCVVNMEELVASETSLEEFYLSITGDKVSSTGEIL